MDSQRKGLIFTPTVSAKTSTLQTWHQPKVKGQCLVKFADLNFETFSYERDNDPSAAKRAKTDYSALKEKCPDGDNCVTVERLEKFSQELSSLGVASQFVEILSANKFQPTHTQSDEPVVIPPANEVWGVYRNHPVCLSVCLFVCPSVCLSRVNLTLVITFQPIEIRLSYYTCWFLVTRPFRPYQKI